jgi:hypothetical protein
VYLTQSVLAIQLPAGYDTVWTTQSNNSAGSMPVGGGDVGLNVWAEAGTVPLSLFVDLGSAEGILS